MASKTFYILADQSAGTSSFGSLQDGGTPPAGFTNDSSAWNVGTASVGTYAEYNRDANRPQIAFTTTVQPDGILDNYYGDCLRTQLPYTGSFLAGTWTFQFVVQPFPSVIYRSSTTANQFTGSSIKLNAPANLAPGDIMDAVIIGLAGIAGFGTLTPPAASGGFSWVLQHTLNGTGGPNGLSTIWRYTKVAGTGEPSSFTWSWSKAGNTFSGKLSAYLNVDNSAPVNAQGVQGGITAPSITTSVAGCMMVEAYALDNSTNALTPPSGEIQRNSITNVNGSSGISLIDADETLPVSGATGTRTATTSPPPMGGFGSSLALKPLAALSGSVSLRLRMFRSTDPAGASPTEITSSTQQSGTIVATSGNNQSATISFNPGAVNLTNEYLFVELALTVVGAATDPSVDWFLVNSSLAFIITPDFADPTLFYRKKKPGDRRLKNKSPRFWKKKSRWQPPDGVVIVQPFFFWPKKKKWFSKKRGPKRRKHPVDWIYAATGFSPPSPNTPLCGHLKVFPSIAATALVQETLSTVGKTRILEVITNVPDTTTDKVLEKITGTAKAFETLSATATLSCCT